MNRYLSMARCGPLHDNEADADHEVDASQVLDESADEADCEAVERLVDGQVEELAN
jgi:hypothetical protein